MKLVVTVVMGRISTGKKTFLIRLPWVERTDEHSRMEVLNQIQERRPLKRKRE